MFTQHKNRIDTDEGFSIIFDRTRFVYEENGRTYRINHELLPSPRSVAIWSASVRELNPEAELSAEKSEAILKNIERALAGVGYHLTVIGQ